MQLEVGHEPCSFSAETPREKRRVRSPGQTVQVQRNWIHKSAGFIDMFLCRLFMKTGRPCPASCLATQTENIWGLRRGGGRGGEPLASSLAEGKKTSRKIRLMAMFFSESRASTNFLKHSRRVFYNTPLSVLVINCMYLESLRARFLGHTSMSRGTSETKMLMSWTCRHRQNIHPDPSTP